MSLKDEHDYIKEDRADLVARLLSAQEGMKFLHGAYNALQNYGVNFKNLPEWKDQSDLDAARKMKPHRAQERIIAYYQRLTHALAAAVRRKQFRVVPTKDTLDDA